MVNDDSIGQGIVVVIFKLADISFQYDNGPRALMQLTRGFFDMPARACAVHKFLEESSPNRSRLNMLIDAAVEVLSPEYRARLRLHYGSYTEWMYESMTYGIPHHLFPLTVDHKIKTKNHLDYLSMRKTAEDIRAASPHAPTFMTDLPANIDVLLGKGKPIQEFRGNQRLSAMVDNYVDRYHEECSKLEKTALAANLVKMVQGTGGRFLSKESGVWREVSDEMAREKVSHMFRHQRKSGNKKKSEANSGHGVIRTNDVMRMIASKEMPGLSSTHKRIKV